jgi:hypothetical protein
LANVIDGRFYGTNSGVAAPQAKDLLSSCQWERTRGYQLCTPNATLETALQQRTRRISPGCRHERHFRDNTGYATVKPATRLHAMQCKHSSRGCTCIQVYHRLLASLARFRYLAA